MAKKKEVDTRTRRLRLLLASTKKVPNSHFAQGNWGRHSAVVVEHHEGLTMCTKLNYCGTHGCTLGSFVASGLGTPEGIETDYELGSRGFDAKGNEIRALNFKYDDISFNDDPFYFGREFFHLDGDEASFLFDGRSFFPEDGKKGKAESIRRIDWLLRGKTPAQYEEKYGPDKV